jgi:hypothetical protein
MYISLLRRNEVSVASLLREETPTRDIISEEHPCLRRLTTAFIIADRIDDCTAGRLIDLSNRPPLLVASDVELGRE